MKNRISDKERLLHILDAIQSIEEFTKDISYAEYIKDFKLRLALIKLLEIIGEASGGITPQTQEQFSDIDWAILKSIRNVLVHEYFGVDYDIIWNVLKSKIPELKMRIELILKKI
jgi:uncharacterized protein with HEPN domain